MNVYILLAEFTKRKRHFHPTKLLPDFLFVLQIPNFCNRESSNVVEMRWFSFVSSSKVPTLDSFAFEEDYSTVTDRIRHEKRSVGKGQQHHLL
jgi:hypothetical protein